MGDKKQNGRVAVVTGAGGMLCSKMAFSLASKGIKVALIGRHAESLSIVENEINASGGKAISVKADVTNLEEVEQANKIIRKNLGICTILINGAGGNQTEAITTIDEFDEKELFKTKNGFRGFFNLNMDLFKNVIEANTMGTVIPCKVFGKEMAKNGGGVIINIASMTSFRPLSRVAAYGMAKSGIAMFTQWLAAYLAPANIRVNAIAPGFFPNNRSRKLLTTPDGGYTDRGAKIMRQTPQKHFGEPGELVGTINYLVDNDASGFVTGIVIPVDGGFLACAGI
jgi:hypothetical protein